MPRNSDPASLVGIFCTLAVGFLALVPMAVGLAVTAGLNNGVDTDHPGGAFSRG